MKLSEAILAGARLRPQTRHSYFSDPSDGPVGSCALGAAYEAVTGQADLDTDDAEFEQGPFGITDLFGIEHTARIVYPVNGARPLVHRVVTLLNDEDGWSREAIAAYLAEQGY
jgi:hypothetical protein